MSMDNPFETDTTRPIAKVPAWTKACNFGLLTADTLPDFVDECIASGKFGLDLETTGLDKRIRNGRTVDKIVGLSLSPDGVRARYVPVRHQEGKEHNVPWSAVSRELHRLQEAMEQKRTTCDYFNGGFDGEMLEYCGDEVPFNPMEDVSTSALSKGSAIAASSFEVARVYRSLARGTAATGPVRLAKRPVRVT